jgi:hypothetical protein
MFLLAKSLSRATIRMRAALAFALSGIASCDSTTEPSNGRIVVTGRLERGSIVDVSVVTDADSLAVLQAAVSFDPVNAAEATFDGNHFVLRTAGPVTVTVSLPEGGTIAKTIDVATPPMIVFDMAVDGNRDIYRAAIDGGELTRLTTDAGTDLQPTAAKGLVIFSSFRVGNGELYSRSLNAGGIDMRLTNSVVNEIDPRVSPDGQRLAYVRDDGSTQRVWIAKANNADAAALTSGFGFGGTTEGSPSWRSGSDSLVFMATATGTARLYLAGATSGAAPAPLMPASSSDSVFVEPAWSPSGATLAFTTGAAGGGSRVALYRRNDATTTFLSASTVSAGQATFLPDGRVVFTVFDSPTSSHLVWVDALDPSVLHPIALTGIAPAHPSGVWP